VIQSPNQKASIRYFIPDSLTTTFQCSAVRPFSILHRSGEFMVTLLFVSLPVAVMVSMANTFSPSATILSISVRESGNSSKSLRPAYLKPSLPSTPLIMLHWIFVQSN
jgi:hypothetical protein